MNGVDMSEQRTRVSRTTCGVRIGATLAIIGVSGCETDRPVSTDLSASDAVSQYSAMAFTATVNARASTVVIAPPRGPGASIASPSLAGMDQPTLSLLGSDVVRLAPSNVRISTLGAYMPGMVRVTFDVTIQNRLPSLVLVAPTWPTPPAPAVLLFPLDFTVTQSPGGATGGDGNTIGVVLPGGGAVTPSIDWNGTGAVGSGAPYNFFTQAPCTLAPSANCFRWIAYGARLLPSEGSATRTVGFDIDPSVAQFRARMIVAADLAPAVVSVP